eukprot:6839852-Prymnesium_polylepis.1
MPTKYGPEEHRAGGERLKRGGTAARCADQPADEHLAEGDEGLVGGGLEVGRRPVLVERAQHAEGTQVDDGHLARGVGGDVAQRPRRLLLHRRVGRLQQRDKRGEHLRGGEDGLVLGEHREVDDHPNGLLLHLLLGRLQHRRDRRDAVRLQG